MLSHPTFAVALLSVAFALVRGLMALGQRYVWRCHIPRTNPALSRYTDRQLQEISQALAGPARDKAHTRTA